MASRIGKKEDLQPTNFFNRFLLWFEHQLENRFIDWYGRQLEWVLSHKLIFTGIVIVAFCNDVGYYETRHYWERINLNRRPGKI
jgi:HAE1 family hydrophobic/amphiphilic exporter-1